MRVGDDVIAVASAAAPAAPEASKPLRVSVIETLKNGSSESMPDWSYHPIFKRVPARHLLRGADLLARVPKLIETVGDTRAEHSPVVICAREDHRALHKLGAARVELGEPPEPPVTSPAEALRRLQAGATEVYVDAAALKHAGPGLPRRINQATAPRPRRASGRAARALGWGMMLAGVIVWLVAQGPVLLGYDYAFVGLSKEQLEAANDRLLPFMQHDRATLAGVMIALGALYRGLAHDGLTRWEWAAVTSSAAIGFASFSLYLGYGYFDPLHFALTIALLPLLIATLVQPPPQQVVRSTDLHNDDTWHRAQRGQLLLVSAALGITVGGLGIAAIGISQVFVGADLAFLQSTREQIEQIDPQLISLIAHDRAGFGGALASAGLGLLIVALRGIQRGDRRLWWTLAAAGLPGFAATTAVHLEVGYSNFLHLAPVLVAGALYTGALVYLAPFMRPPRTRPLRASAETSPSASAGRTR